jgi:hypothetical protein
MIATGGKMLTREETASLIQTLPKSKQAEAANLALEVYGPAPDRSQFETTTYDPITYIQNRLGWEPWGGTPEHPGQVQVLDAYVLALRQLHERDAFEQGTIAEEDLQYWKPGVVIKNWLRIEAGHTVGKTKLASGIINHFYDHFTPSIGYCFAPSWEAIHDLLFKEIKSDRRGKGLPGRILDLALEQGDDHFVKGKNTDNRGGSGTERVQGQHGKYLIFILDEAEGIPDFVWNAVNSMTSGGICIVIMLANPRTRTSRFHKSQNQDRVKSFRMSCIHHPNVVAGREVVPGAVRRQYVEEMLAETQTEVVAEHNHDHHTFELPFPVTVKGVTYEPGTVFKPTPEYMFRVLGIAPANISDKNLIPVGRYDAALVREPISDRPKMARMGVDVARWGKDFGTLYIRHDGRVWRAAQFFHQSELVYYNIIKENALKLAAVGVESLHIRMDAGGGFGGGVVDLLRADMELREAFVEFEVYEVHFNGTPYDQKAFDDVITEITAATAEALNVLRIYNASDMLGIDLCEREYGWVIRKGTGISVKKLEKKDIFRKRLTPQRSPDDGDGFVLAVGADHLFSRFVYSVSDASTKPLPQAGAGDVDALLAVMKKRKKGKDS